MSFVRIDRLLASTSFRIALIFTILLAISFAVAALTTNIATRSAALKESRARITLESGAIRHEAATEGVEAAVAAIAMRSKRPGALEYRLVDARGRTVAGNDALPLGRFGWRTVFAEPVAGAGFSGDYLLYAEPLAGGVLLVGDDLERAERVRDEIMRTLLVVAAVTAAITLAIGVLATRHIFAGLESLSATARLVAEGDLSVRVARAKGPRDDIDEFTETFNAMLDRVAALVANIRRVSTDVAHDLRTPLTHVGQKLERARAATTLELAKTSLDDAQRDLDQVLRTFAAILRLAEIEAGALRARFSAVELGALAERVIDAYRPDVEAGGRQIEVGAETVVVRGESDLLAQALANLIENAMHHTPSGACIRVRVDADDECVTLSVEDDGPGIPAVAREKVLEPFVRLDGSRGSPGAGLGLSIVAAIARLHEAALVLEDRAPGLRVALRIPREPVTSQ